MQLAVTATTAAAIILITTIISLNDTIVCVALDDFISCTDQ